MDSPLVSVIVSAYNRPALFKDALRSVLTQTYSNLEIIIQDDSTNGDCECIVEAIADSRVTYAHNVPPLGTLQNLRAGYLKASGKYFCTLNDDDLFDQRYVQTMVSAMESDSKYSVAFSDHFVIDSNGEVNRDVTDKNSNRFGRTAIGEGALSNPLWAGLVSNCIPGMFALFRRDLMDLEDFPAEVSSGYDHWLTYLALRDGHKAYYCPQRLTYYRFHEDSQSASFSNPSERLRYVEYYKFAHERFMADPRLRPLHGIFRRRAVRVHNSGGFALIRLGNRREAFKRFRTSLRTKLGLRALLGVILCLLPSPALKIALNSRVAHKNLMT